MLTSLKITTFSASAVVVAAAVTLAGFGCSSSSDSGTSGGSSGSGAEGGTDSGGGTDSAAADSGDAGEVVVNSCKTFTDKTAPGAARSITWSFPLSNDDRCWTIKKGQDVTFNGDFTQHPLLVQDGTKPSPIPNHDAAGKVVFNAVGTYGFVCGNHPQMTGAIQVVE